MPLQLDNAGRSFRFPPGPSGLPVDLKFFVNGDAIESGGKNCIPDLLSILHHRRIEIDIVGLPLQGRETHVHLRIRLLVNTSALVIQPHQAERIEDLHLVEINLVKSAVPPPLASRIGLEGKHELHVHDVIEELLSGPNVSSIRIEQAALFIEAPSLPVLHAFLFPIKKNNRTLGGIRPERGRLTDCPLERKGHPLVGFTCKHSLGEHPFVWFVSLRGKRSGRAELGRIPGHVVSRTLGWHKDRLAVVQPAIKQALVLPIPARARQSPRIENGMEASLPEGNDLGSHALTGILSLDLEVGGKLGILGIGPKLAKGVPCKAGNHRRNSENGG